jgi:ferredoxin
MAYEISRYLDCKKRPVFHIESDVGFPASLRTALTWFGPVSWLDLGRRTLVKMDVAGRFHLSAALGGPEGLKVTFRTGRDDLLPLVYKAVWLSTGCDGCGACLPACPEQVLSLTDRTWRLADGCTHCLACLEACPQAPSLPDVEDESACRSRHDSA